MALVSLRRCGGVPPLIPWKALAAQSCQGPLVPKAVRLTLRRGGTSHRGWSLMTSVTAPVTDLTYCSETLGITDQ